MFGTDSSKDFIEVEDRLVNFCQQEHIFDFCKNSKFMFGHSSSTNTSDMSRFVSNLSEEEFGRLELTEILNSIAVNQGLGTIEVLRSYINVYNLSTYLSTHSDDQREDTITFLYYANPNWHPDWGGETVFYNSEHDEIIKSVVPKPGRIAMFKSTIPHASRPPTIVADQQKFTIAIKARIKA